jgi:hypothetical protein
MVTYFSLPSGQRKTQQIADRFNAAEEHGEAWKLGGFVGARDIPKYRRSFIYNSTCSIMRTCKRHKTVSVSLLTLNLL